MPGVCSDVFEQGNKHFKCERLYLVTLALHLANSNILPIAKGKRFSVSPGIAFDPITSQLSLRSPDKGLLTVEST